MNAVTQFQWDPSVLSRPMARYANYDALAEPAAIPRQAPIPRAVAGNTAIATPSGPCDAASLRPGDPVCTRDGATTTISATQVHRLSAADLHAHPDLAPIRFEPGALPWIDLDASVMMVPDQHILLGGEHGEACLMPARAFRDGGLIRRVIPDHGIAYVTLTCAAPALICAAGLWVEVGEVQGTTRTAAYCGPAPVSDRRVFTPL